MPTNLSMTAKPSTRQGQTVPRPFHWVTAAILLLAVLFGASVAVPNRSATTNEPSLIAKCDQESIAASEKAAFEGNQAAKGVAARKERLRAFNACVDQAVIRGMRRDP